ncbi:MAG: F0F1 ATP synthase subunit B [Thermoguttaceae bacterium]|jgi:F-type H+-transporting ATPase subunit b
MRTRLIAGALWLAVVGGLAACGRAEGPAAGAAETSPPASAHGSPSDAADGAQALNPITFHGMSFPGDLTLWTAVVFVVVLVVLWKTAWRPLAEGLQKREDEIAAQIAEAEQKNRAARQLLTEYEQKLAASRDEVRNILDEARRQAEQSGHELLQKAKADAALEHRRAVGQIETAANAAAKELAERGADLAVQLAGKIVGASLAPRDHARLIQEAVAGFTGKVTAKK